MTNPQYGGLLDAITEAVDIQAELDCSVEQARVVQHQPAKPQPKPDIKAVPVQPRHHLAAARALSRSATTRWKKALS